MITFLRGQVVESLPNQLTLDVGGVGYQILIPLSTYDAISAKTGPLTILTHLHIREDAHTLFGFATPAERDLFRMLIGRVSGVGPKIALTILGAISVDEFKSAVVRGDVEYICRVKGLGKKTAERVVLELKDKVGVVEAWEQAEQSASAPNAAYNDALLALINLGYKRDEARRVVAQLEKAAGPDQTANADEIIRSALRIMN